MRLLAASFVLYTLASLIQIAQARTLSISVSDSEGTPVESAVIEVLNATPTSTNLDVAVIDQINKAFVPDQIVIQKNQQVEFPNSDNIRHHVYSFSEIKPFETRLYKGSSGTPITFDRAGVAVLGCNIHDSMVGYIYVADSPFTAVTHEQGKASLQLPNELGNQAVKVRVWHRHLSIDSEKKLEFDVSASQTSLDVNLQLITPPARETFENVF